MKLANNFNYMRHNCLCISIFTIVLFCFAGATGYAAKGDFESSDAINDVNLAKGKADVVELDKHVSDLMLADPSIANVRMLQPGRVYVVGKTVGSTNLIALNESGDVVERLNVNVGLSLDKLRKKVRSLYPDAKINISALGKQVVLDGTVRNGDRAARISRVTAAYVGEKLGESADDADKLVENMLKVRGGQQVMLRVRIVEAQRNVLRELGIAPNINAQSQLLTSRIGTQPAELADVLTGVASGNAAQGLTADNFYAEGSAFLDLGLDGIGPIELFVNALEEEGLGRVLAEPNLTAISGEKATFLAGGEFPIPVAQNDGELQIEFKKFGVSLNFRPEVIARDRIGLQLNAEVSSLDPAEGVSLATAEIPGLDVRRTSTTVEMASGGSLMISGLLRSEQLENMAGLPGVRTTPIVGDLLSSDSFQRDESELMVIVTPYLVQDFKDKSQASKKTKNDLSNYSAKNSNGSPLSKVFAQNIKARYEEKAKQVLQENKANYGYILE